MDNRLGQKVIFGTAIAPVTRSSNADASAGGLLRNGHANALALCTIGHAGAAVSVQFVLEESDDDSTYTTLAETDQIPAASVPWEGMLDARPTKAWVRVTAKVDGADQDNTVNVCAFLLLGDGPYLPETNTNAVIA